MSSGQSSPCAHKSCPQRVSLSVVWYGFLLANSKLSPTSPPASYPFHPPDSLPFGVLSCCTNPEYTTHYQPVSVPFASSLLARVDFSSTDGAFPGLPVDIEPTSLSVGGLPYMSSPRLGEKFGSEGETDFLSEIVGGKLSSAGLTVSGVDCRAWNEEAEFPLSCVLAARFLPEFAA